MEHSFLQSPVRLSVPAPALTLPALPPQVLWHVHLRHCMGCGTETRDFHLPQPGFRARRRGDGTELPGPLVHLSAPSRPQDPGSASLVAPE